MFSFLRQLLLVGLCYVHVFLRAEQQMRNESTPTDAEPQVGLVRLPLIVSLSGRKFV